MFIPLLMSHFLPWILHELWIMSQRSLATFYDEINLCESSCVTAYTQSLSGTELGGLFYHNDKYKPGI